jgi:hypothetical protein
LCHLEKAKAKLREVIVAVNRCYYSDPFVSKYSNSINMTALEGIHLSGNNLTGEKPSILKNL